MQFGSVAVAHQRWRARSRAVLMPDLGQRARLLACAHGLDAVARADGIVAASVDTRRQVSLALVGTVGRVGCGLWVPRSTKHEARRKEVIRGSGSIDEFSTSHLLTDSLVQLRGARDSKHKPRYWWCRRRSRWRRRSCRSGPAAHRPPRSPSPSTCRSATRTRPWPCCNCSCTPQAARAQAQTQENKRTGKVSKTTAEQ